MPDQTIELGQLSPSSPNNGSASVPEQHVPDEEDGQTSSALDRETEAGDLHQNTEQRVIFINRPQPSVPKFVNNRISTAKYSIIRFVPLFLFEQFRRWANVFFLLIALLQQIPDVSPTGRYTTLVPLIFIISVSAIKEIIEDIKRHRADDETNHRKVEVLRGDNWIRVRWMDVIVGDIIKVLNNNFFPADLVLLSSSEPQGMSFIETANLDGETNLKIRQALQSTSKLTTINDLKQLYGTLECEPPNRHLYEFNGVLKETNKLPEPLGPDQILLRGAMLRNTSWIFGVVIYTGHETKLMRNSTQAPLKRSSVDKLTNIQTLLLFGVLFIMCLICAIFNVIWNESRNKADWYIGVEDSSTQSFLYNLLTFLILFNNLIPISLQVTLEVVRFIQAIFINMDIEMYHKDSDTPAMARTSNLNEELGQVKYVFSDKTGTLTRNVMEFKKCAIGHDVYTINDNFEDSILVQNLRQNHKNADLIRELLVLLSVCHTVIPEKMPDGTIVYHAASPDERALVYGASKYGYIFESRTPDYVEIDALGVKERYEILTVLEFTSARKRMSVIVRDPNGKIKLFCKGADTVIYERLDNNSGREHSDILLQHLEHFATEGLRTLCCAVAELKKSDYDDWKQLYLKASISLQHREEKIEEAANLIERKLKLIGATAIEDKLQDGVPEAIATLLQADINVWVLTGDKQETAINIGYSCRLLSHGMQLIILNEDGLDKTRESILRHCDDLGDNIEKSNEIALVIDGKTLKYALTCELRNDFLKLCISCKVVICCRVSPMQKAEVVEYMTKYTKTVTLAIGDGANDVAMIQKAHVGVGISGAEGLQAACASDYSIAQFRFLLRLILVHGAWNYSRMCKLILYSFYKNICLIVIELWFAIYSGWSGQILFERWSIGLYNVLFTALPPLAMGLFDKTCSADKMMSYPKLYKPSQSGQMFNIKVFLMWITNGMIHSAILFWLPLIACQHDTLWMNGQDGGYLVLGNCVYTYVVITVCLKAGLITNSWTWLTHCAIWGSIVLWFLFIIIYSNFWPTIPFGSVMTGMYIMIFTTAVFWLGLFLIPIITILPDFIIKVIHSTVFKSLTDVVRESEIKRRDPDVYRGEPKNSKTTVRKYEKAYKKPIPKNYILTSGNHSQEDSIDNANKILTLGGNVPSFGRADSQRVIFQPSNHTGGPSHYPCSRPKRAGVGSANDDDQCQSGEDDKITFIDLQHNNLDNKKKGILKKHDYGMMMDDGKENWGDGAHSDELPQIGMSQIIGGSAPSEVERTLKTLNGYHEDILKALRDAASQRGTSTPSGSSSALSEELLRRSLQQCAESYSEYKRSSSQEKVCEPQVVIEAEEEDEDEVPPCGPIRIRNLEDLIRQLEHHSRHMSPSGSEDIRMSETEADRHYRQESSSACSESSHQSHRDSRFVYGRYRQPSGRLPYPHPHSHSHHQAEEESIYESADHDRGAPCGDTPDSESDEFIQAQQLARWASEDAVGQAGTSSNTSGPGTVVGNVPREYFPSPSSSTSEEPPSIARAPVPAPGHPTGPPHPDHATIHRPKRYPEYKH